MAKTDYSNYPTYRVEPTIYGGGIKAVKKTLNEKIKSIEYEENRDIAWEVFIKRSPFKALHSITFESGWKECWDFIHDEKSKPIEPIPLKITLENINRMERIEKERKERIERIAIGREYNSIHGMDKEQFINIGIPIKDCTCKYCKQIIKNKEKNKISKAKESYRIGQNKDSLFIYRGDELVFQIDKSLDNSFVNFRNCIENIVDKMFCDIYNEGTEKYAKRVIESIKKNRKEFI